MKSFTLPITVTQDDINKGQIRDCWHCPVALAINRALQPLQTSFKVTVTPCYIRIRDPYDPKLLNIEQTIPEIAQTVPEIARKFVILFDDNNSPILGSDAVEPFSFIFTIHIPDHIQFTL